MRVGEILRNIADQIDAVDAKKSAELLMRQAEEAAQTANAIAQDAANDAMSKSVDQAPEPEEVEVDNTDCTDVETMVPPLQQKHELLKKATGVDNNVDDFADENDEENINDELAVLQKMAGIGQEQAPVNMADTIGPITINPRANAAMAHFASDNYDAE